MMNVCVLIGRLTRDPELHYTTNGGKAVANFSIAVERRQQDDQGKNLVDFVNIVAWQKTAEAVVNYMTKGRLVCVEGRLQVRKYTTNEGQKRVATEVVAQQVRFLDRPKEQQNGGGQPAQAAQAPVEADEEIPF